MLTWVSKPLVCVLIIFSSLFYFSSALARPASVVSTNNFGSDPYRDVAQLDGYFIVSGREGTGAPYPGSGLDILTFEQDSFEVIKQYNVTLGLDSVKAEQVLDLVVQNEHLLLLMRADNSSNGLLASAVIDNAELRIVDTLEIDYAPLQAKLHRGDGNNFYISRAFGSINISHFRMDEEGGLSSVSSKNFGELATGQISYDERIQASYSNNRFVVSAARADDPAVFYQVEIGDDGIPGVASELVFTDAGEEYEHILFDGEYLYMSYHFWGFQIAKLDGDTITQVYSFDENSWFDDFVVHENRLYAIDTFSTVDVFDLSDMQNVVHLQSYTTSGFSHGGVIVDNTLFVTQGWQGIRAASISESGNLSDLAEFSWSGEITDFSLDGGRLFTSALDRALNIWEQDQNGHWAFASRFNTGGVAGVHADGDKVYINGSGAFEQHELTDVLADNDVGMYVGSTGSSGRDGQLLKLHNGYVAKTFEELRFFTDALTQVSSLTIPEDTNYSGYTQRPFATDKRLYVPVNTNPGKVFVYDIEDITDVSLLGEVERGGSFIYGTVVEKDSILYAPEFSDNFDPAIGIYDVTDLASIEKLGTIDLGNDYTNRISPHLLGDYLVVVSEDARLFDITTPSEPLLIHTNPDINTNGTAATFSTQLFSVPKNSGGTVIAAELNLAPQILDQSLNTPEDTEAELSLPVTDGESDILEYSVLMETQNGAVTFPEPGRLVYSPNQHYFGEDSGVVAVEDEHGNSSQFSFSVTISAVNDAPVLLTTELSISEDTSVDVQLAVEDVDSELFQFELTSEPTHGSAALTDAGVLTYEPQLNFFGDDSVEVSVEDAEGEMSTQVVSITVSEVNDLPDYTGETSAQGLEDTAVSFAISATDVDSDVFSFDVLGLPSDWSYSFEENLVEVVPAEDANGTFEFTLTVSDGVDTTEQTMSLQLDPVNDAPTAENTALTSNVVEGSSVNTSLNVVDVDGDELTYDIVEAPTKGTAVISAQGVLTYNANAGESGSDSMVVEVTDMAGESTTLNLSLTISARPAPTSSGGSGGGGSLGVILVLLAMVSGLRRAKSST